MIAPPDDPADSHAAAYWRREREIREVFRTEIKKEIALMQSRTDWVFLLAAFGILLTCFTGWFVMDQAKALEIRMLQLEQSNKEPK